MKKLTKKYLIKADIRKVWEALTDGASFTIWSGAPAVLVTKEDTKFTLWDGEITGKTLKIIPYKQLIQEWNFGNWASPSIVQFIFMKKGKATEVTLINENIPDNEFDDIYDGWDDYIFDPIKEFLE